MCIQCRKGWMVFLSCQMEWTLPVFDMLIRATCERLLSPRLPGLIVWSNWKKNNPFFVIAPMPPNYRECPVCGTTMTTIKLREIPVSLICTWMDQYSYYDLVSSLLLIFSGRFILLFYFIFLFFIRFCSVLSLSYSPHSPFVTPTSSHARCRLWFRSITCSKRINSLQTVFHESFSIVRSFVPQSDYRESIRIIGRVFCEKWWLNVFDFTTSNWWSAVKHPSNEFFANWLFICPNEFNGG